jgi:hypothetical protein
VSEPDCLNCRRLMNALEAVQRDLENVEVELRVKRSQLTKARNELDAESEDDPQARDARTVFTYWRCRLKPLAKTFKGKRQRAVLEMLKTYSVLDLMDAIDGAKVTAKLEFICRDASIVDRYRCAAAAHAAWLDRALHGERVRFEVTEELVREGIVVLAALRAGVEPVGSEAAA